MGVSNWFLLTYNVWWFFYRETKGYNLTWFCMIFVACMSTLLLPIYTAGWYTIGPAYATCVGFAPAYTFIHISLRTFQYQHTLSYLFGIFHRWNSNRYSCLEVMKYPIVHPGHPSFAVGLISVASFINSSSKLQMIVFSAISSLKID